MGDWHANASLTPVNKRSSGQRGSTVLPDDFLKPLAFTSRRSPVLCRHACVATSQPLASSIGLDMLRKGANAAETAVAVAAALAVTEPCSTGLGGDVFCLYYQNSDKKVYAVNGSGRSPQGLSLELIETMEDREFTFSAHAVTVPGAARAYEDIVERFGSGKLHLRQILEPAAQLAEEGFPVSPITAHHWNAGMGQIAKWVGASENSIPMTVDGEFAPEAGQVFCNPDMARVLRELGDRGAAEGFYRGATGRAIVDAVQTHGGCLTLDDMAAHESLFPDPIAASYRCVDLWQVPPNGQGVAALVALSGLQQLEEASIIPRIEPSTIGSADVFHAEVEMMRLGFADAQEHVACPDHTRVTNGWLLDKERIAHRAQSLFDPKQATIHGASLDSSCTVSFQVVDAEGNAMSFVNSNFMGFGTGIVPKGCGFTLQNRGAGFSREKGHPNVLGGGKRPYHTIIPGMLTNADDGSLYATLSNMGGYQQPQGHMQLTVDLVAGGMDPQAAVDMPRFCISNGKRDGVVHFEEGVPQHVIEDLENRGHTLRSNVCGHARSIFGRAQIIKRDRKTGVLWAGSDGRADGCAIGF